MAAFEPIIQWLLYQEDSKKHPGEVVDLKDGAGLTRLGLTQRWHSKDVPLNFFTDLEFNLAVAAAKSAYKKLYWYPINGDLLPDVVAAPLLSFAVNDDVAVAVATLQHVLGVLQDGKMGPKTLETLAPENPGAVSRAFRAAWIDFYHREAAIHPNKQQFLNGWINRANFPYPSTEVPNIYA